jgi:hypothetical protein
VTRASHPPDPRDYDLRRLNIEASRMDCPNGPDEDGHWPCDPKGYFGVAECQVCGRIGVLRDAEKDAADD